MALALLAVASTAHAQFSYVTNNGTITITGYFGAGGVVIVPDTLDGLQVTTIGPSVFANRNLTSVTLPESLTSIQDCAFSNCFSLATANLPNNLTNIGSAAFFNGYKLGGVTIPVNVVAIGKKAFASCTNLSAIDVVDTNPAYTSVDGVLFNKSQTMLIQCPGNKAGSYAIPASVISVGDYAFSVCRRLTGITIPEGVQSHGDHAFANCIGLSSMAIPNSFTNLADRAFSGCTALTNVLLGTNVLKVGDYAFMLCRGLRTIEIPDSVLAIGKFAFQACDNLTNVILGINLTTISRNAFLQCTSLPRITIPEHVTTIDEEAFNSCFSLRAVLFLGDAPTAVGTGLFTGASAATVYYLPETSGWEASFGGRPAMLWNPEIQTAAADFDVRTNRFGFSITGTSNIPVAIEATAELSNADWMPVQSVTLTNGAFYFADPEWTNFPARFFRLRSP